MISEGSCDTEDWVMMLKIQLCFTGINNILKYIKIEYCYFKMQQYFKNIFFIYIFKALTRIRNFLILTEVYM